MVEREARLIGVDARKLRDYGIGRYLTQLVRAMVDLKTGHRFTAILRPVDMETDELPEEVNRVASSAGHYGLRELLELSAIARREKFNLYHAPHYVLPLALPCPSVVTIHDLIHLHAPRDYDFLQVLGARFLLKRASRASAVLTVSETSARDINNMLNVPAERVTVTPNAVCPEFFREPAAGSIRQIREKLGFNEPYLLHVGNDKPHKNLPFLIECYAGVASRARLVLTVPGDSRTVRESIARFGLQERVVCTGFVEGAMLHALYCGATALVFPSLYEGFGLPPLEAMACGTAVLCSSIGALQEVVGSAGLTEDPRDLRRFRTALAGILEDESLRRELEIAGRKRARMFSWERTASQTIAVYEKALSRGGSRTDTGLRTS